MDLNPHNLVVKLCVRGTQAEFNGKKDEACKWYHQAWNTAADDYEACIAAHYMARCSDSPEEILRWNQEALERANAIKNGSVQDFYPSLYLNLGLSFERVGNPVKAKKYFDLAEDLGFPHQMD